MTPEQICDKYEPRIRAILEKIRDAAASLGDEAGEVDDLTTDEDYTWTVYVRSAEQVEAKDHEAGIDFTFTICESENTDGEKNGVTFRIDVTAYGGEVLGTICPYNYTDDAWISRDDEAAIEARFLLVEDFDHETATRNLLNKRFRSAETVSP